MRHVGQCEMPPKAEPGHSRYPRSAAFAADVLIQVSALDQASRARLNPTDESAPAFKKMLCKKCIKKIFPTFRRYLEFAAPFPGPAA